MRVDLPSPVWPIIYQQTRKIEITKLNKKLEYVRTIFLLNPWMSECKIYFEHTNNNYVELKAAF
jgi:hypothetical protein